MNPKHSGGYYLGRLLRQTFPEQTKTVPRIILWTLVFLLDAGLVIWAAVALDLIGLASAWRAQSLVVGLIVAVALGLFSLEVWVYNRILRAVRKRKETYYG